MEPIIKCIVALITMALLGSCSSQLSNFETESKYINKNKGKEQGLRIEITIPDDTVYAGESTYIGAKASLTYSGSGYYYLYLGPETARMDWNFYRPNSINRTFYHLDSKCKINDEYMLHMPDQRDFISKYSYYKLRPGKSIDFDCGIDAKKLRYGDAKWDEDNSEFGKYEMQLVYITELKDTIRSEKVSFWYLEKDE